ncbi:MAG: Phosphoserine phosphatase RsbU [Bacteroidota bacterium]
MLLLFSCNNKEKKDGNAEERTGLTVQKAEIKPAGKAAIKRLSECPKPTSAQLSSSSLFVSVPENNAEKPATLTIPLKNYTTENGLGINAVICGYCDKRGNLWFGTNGGGVSCYNGQRFVNYTANQGLADNIVRCIVEDSLGRMWFGTRGGGISCFDGHRFLNFSTSAGLNNSDIRAMKVFSKEIILIATEGGGLNEVFLDKANIRIRSRKLAQLSDQEIVQSVNQGGRFSFWVGTKSKGAYLFDIGDEALAPIQHVGMEDGLPDTTVTAVFTDADGHLWLGTTKGLYRQLGKQHWVYTKAEGLADDHVLCIFQDKSGKMWIGTQNGGVSCLDPTVEPASSRPKIQNFSTENGLSNNQIYSISEDQSNNLWFGSWGGGVMQYSGKSISRLMASDGGKNLRVVSLVEDTVGNLWFGNQHSVLSRYNGKSITSYSHPLLTKAGVIRGSTIDKKGRIWLATSGAGLCCFDGKTLYSYTQEQGLAGDNMRSVFEDRKGRIWAGSFKHGVSCMSGDSVITYTTNEGIVGNEVWNIMEDRKGRIWFSTHGNGASCFDGKTFTNYTVNQGLPGNVIWNITEDEAGMLWFASDGGGISRFDGNDFYTISLAQGLGDDVILSTRIAKDGSIWMGTNKGFSVLKQFRSKHVKTRAETASNQLSNAALRQREMFPLIEIYNKKTGFSVEDLYPNSMYFDRKGIVWAGTTDGLVRFDYWDIEAGLTEPILELNAVRVNNERICWRDLLAEKTQIDSGAVPASIAEEVAVFGRKLSDDERIEFKKRFNLIEIKAVTPFTSLPQGLVLPYSMNKISFDFAAIETARPNLVRYQYWLDGYDKDWSPESEKTTATFGNIPEGNYMFRVKARSPEGVWGKELQYSFRVLPPWYRTWWALTLAGIIILVMLYSVFRWRTISLVRDKRKLESTVRERTNEMVQQKELVEYKNREILSSIKYAKRIQTAILPSNRLIHQYLPESFVFYSPKDIVAGDFYWLEEAGDWILFAACDCTGHGVPGAMVSVVCNNALNRAVREFGLRQPAQILDKVAQLVVENFSASDDFIEDGMDISLCALNKNSLELQWAGANNPLWMIRNGELNQYRPDKQPVGQYESPMPFSNHTIQLEKGDLLYLFSDGYADQFGGEGAEKKLTRKRFRELLLSISGKSMTAQGEFLESFIINYRNDLPQIDDILVIGVRV